MSNPSKQKGTAAESAVVRHVQVNGFPHAYRNALTGSKDHGDVTLCPGVIVEVKSHAGGPSTGQPTPGVLAEWMRQTDVERAHARADFGVLVVKRSGTTDPSRWFAYVPFNAVAELLTGTSNHSLPDVIEETPVCLCFGVVLLLLRAAGWGSPLDIADYYL